MPTNSCESENNNCRCSDCINSMSSKSLFDAIVHDSLNSGIITKCWNHLVDVNLNNFNDVTDENQQTMLNAVVQQIFEKNVNEPESKRLKLENQNKFKMPIFVLLKYSMAACFDSFSDDPDIGIDEANNIVSTFMWTAIGGVMPWTSFVVVNE